MDLAGLACFIAYLLAMVCNLAVDSGPVFCQSPYYSASDAADFGSPGELLFLALAARVVKPGACHGRFATTHMGLDLILYLDLGNDACEPTRATRKADQDRVVAPFTAFISFAPLLAWQKKTVEECQHDKTIAEQRRSVL